MSRLFPLHQVFGAQRALRDPFGALQCSRAEGGGRGAHQGARGALRAPAEGGGVDTGADGADKGRAAAPGGQLQQHVCKRGSGQQGSERGEGLSMPRTQPWGGCLGRRRAPMAARQAEDDDHYEVQMSRHCDHGAAVALPNNLVSIY